MSSEAKTPPTFPKKITSLQQTEGQPIRFECRVAGSSPIEVSWLKDGEPLKEGAEFSMLYDDNTAALQIERGQMRHSGEYTCVATNSVGSASCRAKLTLQGVWGTWGCGGWSAQSRAPTGVSLWLVCRAQVPASL